MPTLQFKGKTAVQTYHYTVPHHTLAFDPAASVLEDGLTPSLDGNVIIEGDNLLALKALLPTHTGRIKCVYIDPPYNTGNEGWVYNDNLTQPQFKEWIGQVVGKEGEDACRHDKWCCMMYPRLMLLKELLREDGVIFVSIDDNEVASLRFLMDDVFGSENFIACVANVNNPKGRSDDRYVATAHEYLMIYQMGKVNFGAWLPDDIVIKRYNKSDDEGLKYREIDLRKTGDNDRREDRENLFYYFLYNKLTGELKPTKDEQIPEGFIQILPLKEDGSHGNWRWELKTAQEKLSILIPKMMPVRKVWTVFEKDYLEAEETVKPTTAWTKPEFNSERGSEQFRNLGFDKENFQRPKPIGLLGRILELGTKPGSGDIILDSFAGSGTTGQAVLELNKEDGGSRKFILVQQKYDSKDDEKKKLNICRTITAERVRRVIAGQGVPATGGGFTYARVSETPLFGEYRDFGDVPPPYEDLAKYVFYTETSRQWDPAGMNRETGLIGAHGGTSYFLLYTPDGEANAALDLKWLGSAAASDPNARLVVYCEKFWMHRDELRRWEGDHRKSVRPMIVPFQLK